MSLLKTNNYLLLFSIFIQSDVVILPLHKPLLSAWIRKYSLNLRKVLPLSCNGRNIFSSRWSEEYTLSIINCFTCTFSQFRVSSSHRVYSCGCCCLRQLYLFLEIVDGLYQNMPMRLLPITQ